MSMQSMIGMFFVMPIAFIVIGLRDLVLRSLLK